MGVAFEIRDEPAGIGEISGEGANGESVRVELEGLHAGVEARGAGGGEEDDVAINVGEVPLGAAGADEGGKRAAIHFHAAADECALGVEARERFAEGVFEERDLLIVGDGGEFGAGVESRIGEEPGVAGEIAEEEMFETFGLGGDVGPVEVGGSVVGGVEEGGGILGGGEGAGRLGAGKSGVGGKAARHGEVGFESEAVLERVGLEDVRLGEIAAERLAEAGHRAGGVGLGIEEAAREEAVVTIAGGEGEGEPEERRAVAELRADVGVRAEGGAELMGAIGFAGPAGGGVARGFLENGQAGGVGRGAGLERGARGEERFFLRFESGRLDSGTGSGAGLLERGFENGGFAEEFFFDGFAGAGDFQGGKFSSLNLFEGVEGFVGLGGVIGGAIGAGAPMRDRGGTVAGIAIDEIDQFAGAAKGPFVAGGQRENDSAVAGRGGKFSGEIDEQRGVDGFRGARSRGSSPWRSRRIGPARGWFGRPRSCRSSCRGW